MIDQIETLIALKKHKTMTQTSTALRLSQSTISKRISALEEICKTKLLIKKGRNVYLSDEAEKLIMKTSPLLIKIKDALSQSSEPKKRIQKIKLGVSESILSSWGPKKILPHFKNKNIEYELHCHRSPTVLDKVMSGEYDLGVCAGKLKKDTSLIFDLMTKEEMVLVSTKNTLKEILSIEENSSTWREIKHEVKLKTNNSLESFFSIAQLAKSGISKGLIPIGVSKELSFNKSDIKSLTPKLKRSIWLVYRKNQLNNQEFKILTNNLKKIKL